MCLVHKKYAYNSTQRMIQTKLRDMHIVSYSVKAEES